MVENELAESIVENGITYHLAEDGCYYPQLSLEQKTDYVIGKYGIKIRKEPSKVYFGGVVIIEEILRFRDMKSAEQLVEAITKDWVAGATSFDVEKWVITTNMSASVMRDLGNYYEMGYERRRETEN